ncbi:MAG: hypothetical protein JWO94_795 [Verrucomicrobiaceae bacterium]|nr:hypothetical protein [Verrucomicrobiaceae bacterium]
MKELIMACFLASSAFAAEDKVAECLPEFAKALDQALQRDPQTIQSAMITSAVADFEKKVLPTDTQYLENYARQHASDEDGTSWALLPVFVIKGRMDIVAEIASITLAREDNRQYRMWKWWETLFGKQPDYSHLSRNLGRAFLKRFEEGDQEERMVIGSIFGEKSTDVEEFRKFIENGGQTKQ